MRPMRTDNARRRRARATIVEWITSRPGIIERKRMAKMATRGFIVVAMASMLVGPVSAQDQPKIAPPTFAPHGRYQIVISPFSERNTYLIDTETGAVWQLQVFNSLNGEPLVWNLMPRVSNDDDMARVVSQFGKKPGAKTTQPTSISPEPRQ
jgi:hypothetical protein